jgi:hypothetical protein
MSAVVQTWETEFSFILILLIISSVEVSTYLERALLEGTSAEGFRSANTEFGLVNLNKYQSQCVVISN